MGGAASKTLLMPHTPMGIQITAQGQTEIPSQKERGGKGRRRRVNKEKQENKRMAKKTKRPTPIVFLSDIFYFFFLPKNDRASLFSMV